HACYFGVQGLTGNHLGIDVREWWMPWWLQGEPNIGIGCDLPLNRGLGVVRTSQTEQGAGYGCLRDHFAFNEKTGQGQRRCQGHEGFHKFFWQCQPICPPEPPDLVERHRLIETFELCLHGTAYVHERLYPCIRTGANEDLATNGMGLDTIGSIDRAPPSAVFGTFDRTIFAKSHFARVNANAHSEFGHVELALLSIEFQECQLHREGTCHGAFRIVRSGEGSAKKRQHTIALQFVHSAPMAGNDLNHALEIAIENGNDLRR